MLWVPLLVLAVPVCIALALSIVLSVRARRSAEASRESVVRALRQGRPVRRPEEPLDELRLQVETLHSAVQLLGRRLSDVEGRTERLAREVRSRPAALPAERAAAGDAPSAEERLRVQLADQGYEDTVFLDDPAHPGTWLVEARRRGLWIKGSARSLPGGAFEVRLEPATRAFP